MKETTSFRRLALLLSWLVLFVPNAFATVWNLTADYSTTTNPNGPWSYDRKWSANATAADPMTVQWGSAGWYLGNFGHGGPSIQGYVLLWAKNNSNGLPTVRWTAPNDGFYDIDGVFTGADDRGVDSYVYTVIDGATLFTDRLTAYLDTATFSLDNIYLHTGSTVDFVQAWAGGVSSEASWVRADATIAYGSGIPEPAGYALFGCGITLLMFFTRRQRRCA